MQDSGHTTDSYAITVLESMTSTMLANMAGASRTVTGQTTFQGPNFPRQIKPSELPGRMQAAPCSMSAFGQ